ncbi:MAG TPA: peptidoglycan DD-metalloendopeptidase family protein [Flavobacterium sp.]|jgi:murein DD-endopeptidase MepM/ murein hydrolase activator NlpD
MQDLVAVLKSIQGVKVIDGNISVKEYMAIDLSVSNEDLYRHTLETADDFEAYIDNYLAGHNAKVAFGGYNEERNLYKRSTLFNETAVTERNIHIGLDLWVKAGTPVLSALDGVIHSFSFNEELGNYGPTIILKHQEQGITFYTLYGHLSAESIDNLTIGASVTKGQQMATLGDAYVNGDYAPHLHFQIIKDIQENFGDYPGVCSKNDLNFYLENCPDPNLLLKLNDKYEKNDLYSSDHNSNRL